MANPPLVTVGLVTWNSAAPLDACLTALAGQTWPHLELIVVDNASTDDSLAQVQRRWPTAQVLANTENRGYAGGHNQALRLARGAYYLALNPDVVLAPEYVAQLVTALEARPECGAAGGKLLLAPGQLDSTGLFIDRRRRQYLRGHGEADRGQYPAGPVFGLDGAAPLYRRAMLEEVAFEGQVFDEAFFAYKEDVDLAWRARWLGWGAWYAPEAVAEHTRTFRPGRRERGNTFTRRLSVRNRYLLLMKNEMPAGWRRDGLRILLYDLAILGYLLLREPRSLGALREAYQLWPVMRRWRADLAARRRVPPEAALEWHT